MFDIVQRIDNRLAVVERGLVIALTGAIATVMMTQVILRYFFSAPLFWAEEISVQMLVTATLFGISLLVHHGQLVSIDFLPRALPKRARHALLTVLGLVLLALFVFIAWLGWDWIGQPSTRLELTATTQLPRWYNYAALPVAMSVMAWHQVVAIARELRSLLGVGQ